jgi:hypothetical protein
MTGWTAVIALLIAIYGAFLSTLNFLRAGAKLRFKVQPGERWSWLSSPAINIVQIEVTNYGGRPTTLKNITIRYFEHPRSWEWLRNRATREVVLSDGLPFELNPGGVWSGMPGQAQFTEWGTKGVWYFDLYHSHSTKPLRRRVRF